MRVAADLNPVFGAIRGSFWTPNQFLAQSSPGFRLQIGFWCNPRRVWGFKLVFGAILGGFWTFRHPEAQTLAGFRLSDTRKVQSLAGLGGAGDSPPSGSYGRAYAIRPYTRYPADFPASAEAAGVVKTPLAKLRWARRPPGRRCRCTAPRGGTVNEQPPLCSHSLCVARPRSAPRCRG